MFRSRPASPTEDVQVIREASKHRLLGVWASLADRYTRRLDEDDIVDIRTGEITIDRGFIRKSRKVDFGAIAAPDAEDAIADESEEEEDYDNDELDAFADPPDEVDVRRMGLRVKPVPPMTALNSVDAEDLRSFLDAERRRKHLCGSDAEEEEEEDEVVVVVEDEDEEEGEDAVQTRSFRSSKVPQSESEAESPRKKRKPVYSDPHNLPSTVSKAQSESEGESPRKKRKPLSSDPRNLPSTISKAQSESEAESPRKKRKPVSSVPRNLPSTVSKAQSESEGESPRKKRKPVYSDPHNLPSTVSKAQSESEGESPRKKRKLVSSDPHNLPSTVGEVPGELKHIFQTMLLKTQTL